jgi:hypothetical protein
MSRNERASLLYELTMLSRSCQELLASHGGQHHNILRLSSKTVPK